MSVADQSDLSDLQHLVRPISDEKPAGSDPRLDVSPQSLYFRLRDARSEARAAERAADNDPAVEAGGARHWLAVRALAVEALAGTGKDIEIAAWLAESLVRTDGLVGLTVGAQLLAELVAGYWDTGLFPTPDEDGVVGRTAPVAGLNGEGGNGTLLQPLRKLILYERADGTPVTFWRFEQAEEAEALDPARRTQRLAAGALPFAQLEAEAKAIGRDRLGVILRDVLLTIEAWRALDAALAGAAQADAPPTGRVLELLDKLRRIAERYAPQTEPVAELAVLAAIAPGEPCGDARRHAAGDHPDRGLFPGERAALAPQLHAGGCGPPRPAGAAGSAEGDDARAGGAIDGPVGPRHPAAGRMRPA